jgi:mannosyl-3-phosphoglycerate phosphatase
VIPVTSKTRAELKELREQLNLASPFIVENGSAVFLPEAYVNDHSILNRVDDYWVYELSPNLEFWTTLVDQLAAEFPQCFKSFSQMSLEEIVDLTGLTLRQASSAATREYSDPLYWFGGDEQFKALGIFCQRMGVNVVKGGRFVHLLKGADKGAALKWLHQYLSMQSNEELKSVALGDGENDLAMLEVVDIAVQIKSPQHTFPSLNKKGLIKTHAFGPAGWSEAIQEIFGTQFK